MRDLSPDKNISGTMSGSPASLRGHKEFRRLLFGSATSMLGSRLSTIAFPMLILAITGSAVTAGFAVFAVTMPSILVYIPAGVLVDRWNPRWTMVASESGRGLAIAVIVGMLAFHRLEVPAIVCCATAEEILEVFATLAERRYVSALAGPDLSCSALMRTEARGHAVVLVGRPLGGLLFEIGSPLPFAADALSFVVSITSLFGLRDVIPARDSGADLRQVGREMYEGLRFLCGDFRSRMTVAMKAPMTLVSQALIMIFIVEAHGSDMSAIVVSSVLACSGIGGFLGALIGPRIPALLGKHTRLKIQLLIWAAALFILSISGSSWQLYCMAGVMIMFGFTGAMGNVEFDMYLAARAPDMLGRLTSIERLMSFAASATGPALGGILAQECGYRTAERWLFALTVSVGLLSVLVVRARKRASRAADMASAAELEPAAHDQGNPLLKGANVPLNCTGTDRGRRSGANRLRLGHQDAAQQLPRLGLRQFRAEHDAVRRLRGTEPLPDPLPDLFRVALPDHDGDHALAPLGIGHADHGRLGDAGVAEEHVLDLGRGDVLAAPDDGVVGAALDEQVAAGVQPAAVPGGEPAARVQPAATAVLTGDLVAAHEDETGLPRRGQQALLGADLELDTGQRQAHGPEPVPHRGVGRRQRRAVVLGDSTVIDDAVSVSP
jgi:MFS family permease